MRRLFDTATAVFQVIWYKKVQCSGLDQYSDDTSKVFNDPIHGHIELPAICVQIINTPEFLRLRQIKQLGAVYEVFPGASHNRFEHCLGVCHLAGVFGRHLQQQIDEELMKTTTDVKKEMKITKDDLICLQIAGLCHDLGHGPMSHVFESHFIRKLDPFSKWKHEDGSLMMFDYLVEKNKIPIKSKDRVFIKQLIHRDQKKKDDTGRPKEKDFLYEVISNDENGIDVDKWDYFARDCYHLGFKNNFDHNRLIKFSRVIKVDGGWHICYRDKQVEDIYHMFLSRVILHRRACQHKTVQILERMYMEALVKANDHYLITKQDGNKLKLSECITDPEAFSQLTDHVFRDIRNSSDEKMKEAKDILTRIDKRKHYKLVSEAIPSGDKETRLQLSNDEILEEIVESLNGKLTKEDLVVDIATFDYGRKDKNPVDNVYFYNKTTDGEKYRAFHMYREDVSQLLPDFYSEHRVRLYIKKDDKELLEEARNCFRRWCEKRNMRGPWKFHDPPTD